MEAPEERFAALLGGHASPLAAEELVLRARADVDAGRMREAALQARVALEALLAELDPPASEDLERERPPVAEAANLALRGDLTPEAVRARGDASSAWRRRCAACGSAADASTLGRIFTLA